MIYPLQGKVVLLNAPPNTGKDFAAEYLNKATAAHVFEFKSTIFNIAIAMTGLSREEYFEIYNNRELKELPHQKFLGKSPRGLNIWISENVMKPEFGEGYFGKAVVPAVMDNLHKGVVFSDSGFPQEASEVCKYLERPSDLVVVRFTRNGATFEGDSRDYLKEEDLPKGVRFFDTDNDGDIEDFVDDIVEFVLDE